ncbi:hypothetical protein [Winogradskyella sp. SYSU M77433]|uniref:hypothetical protein n=1 Tax=Winogradskyella sp. SYSU M77433 TaxID=3042722 RepID=UPI0024816E26|nr:hypothetical protein [Winogradskyella sp. SYSU M77433]MDH7911510.1 hypothetical protein [Winogradskyella sp. SYSU M77433]
MSILSVFILFTSIIGPHFLNSLISLFPLLFIVGMFFKLRNPIFLTVFLALLFQWLQINIKLIYGSLTNSTLDVQFSFHKDDEFIYQANYISNIGLIFFSIGIYLPLKKRFANFDILKEISFDYDPKKVLRNYILFSLGISFLLAFRNSLPGINTIVTAFSKLKWGLLVLTFVYCNFFNESKKVLYFVLVLEVFIGFTGYFSGFKDIILIVVIALLSLQNQLESKTILKFSVIFLFVLSFGVFWTAIKKDYREYLSGGERSQRVVVDKSDAISEFFNQASEFSLEDVGFATEALLDRVSYIEFFSIVLRNVPQYIPYERGEIIKESTFFYFKPRIFFPEKAVVDDSDHTNKYTRLELWDNGKASHSIGFMTDAYIDFGVYGMMVLLMFLGVVFGWSMNFLLIKSPNMFWGVLFIVPFYFLLSVYSFNMMKVMGNFITYIIPILLIRKIMFKIFNKYFLR